MIKIHSVVRDILLEEMEAVYALTQGYMNMSSFAHRIRKEVAARSKKSVTITSLVVALSRLRREFQKVPPLVHDVKIKNITTKLPLAEIMYENNERFKKELETLHKSISVSQDDFFTVTMGTSEADIMCSSSMANKILKHFKQKPKITNHGFAAIGISYGSEVFGTPNVFFSLLAVTARARINIEELISTPTELIFIVAEKDFARTVALFSDLYKIKKH